MASEKRPSTELVVYERVLCLECGFVYAKPAKGGTTRENPGCPRCGYVGWIAVHASGGASTQPGGQGRIRKVG
jgi:hypothetical protein